MKLTNEVVIACTLVDCKEEYSIYRLDKPSEEVVEYIVKEVIHDRLVKMLEDRDELVLDSVDNRLELIREVLLDPTTYCYLGVHEDNITDVIVMVRSSSIHCTDLYGNFILWVDSQYGMALYRTMLSDISALGVRVVNICRYKGDGKYENKNIVLRR